MIGNDDFQEVLFTGLSLDHFSLLNWYIDYREAMVLVPELTRSSRNGIFNLSLAEEERFSRLCRVRS